MTLRLPAAALKVAWGPGTMPPSERVARDRSGCLGPGRAKAT